MGLEHIGAIVPQKRSLYYIDDQQLKWDIPDDLVFKQEWLNLPPIDQYHQRKQDQYEGRAPGSKVNSIKYAVAPDNNAVVKKYKEEFSKIEACLTQGKLDKIRSTQELTIGGFLSTTEQLFTGKREGHVGRTEELKMDLYRAVLIFWNTNVSWLHHMPLPETLDFIVKPLGSQGTIDPLDQRASIGLKISVPMDKLKTRVVGWCKHNPVAFTKLINDRYSKAMEDSRKASGICWTGWIP